MDLMWSLVKMRHKARLPLSFCSVYVVKCIAGCSLRHLQ